MMKYVYTILVANVAKFLLDVKGIDDMCNALFYCAFGLDAITSYYVNNLNNKIVIFVFNKLSTLYLNYTF